MSTQEQDFQWTDALVADFAEWYRKQQGAPLKVEHWGKDLLKVYKDEVGEKRSPEYEILSFRYFGDIYTLMDWEKYPCYTQPTYATSGGQISLSWALEHPGVVFIHSVRRLSDGEVFTIGDTVYRVDGLYPVTITEFYQPPSERGEMWFYWSGFKETVKNLDNFKKQESLISPPKVLFTTEEGMDVTDPEQIILYVSQFKIRERKAKNACAMDNKRFARRDAAERYVLENKPVLSVRDVWSLTAKYGYDMMALENDVINLAKEKL